MDKAEAIKRIARRLRGQFATTITWAQFVTAMQDLTAAEKAHLLGAVRLGNADAAGNTLIRQVREWADSQAVVEATAMLDDDAISLAELDKVI
jgi:cell division inhibitor SulA